MQKLNKIFFLLHISIFLLASCSIENTKDIEDAKVYSISSTTQAIETSKCVEQKSGPLPTLCL